jgi:uncharacterized delta-60 repeat protein
LIGSKLILLFILIFTASCNDKPIEEVQASGATITKDDDSGINDNVYNDIPVEESLEEINSATMVYPSLNSSKISKPIISVDGLQTDDIVLIYSDSSCQSLVGSKVIDGTQGNLPISLTGVGQYSLYGKYIRDGKSSSCSTDSILSYSLLLSNNRNFKVESISEEMFQNNCYKFKVSLIDDKSSLIVAPVDLTLKLKYINTDYSVDTATECGPFADASNLTISTGDSSTFFYHKINLNSVSSSEGSFIVYEETQTYSSFSLKHSAKESNGDYSLSSSGTFDVLRGWPVDLTYNQRRHQINHILVMDNEKVLYSGMSERNSVFTYLADDNDEYTSRLFIGHMNPQTFSFDTAKSTYIDIGTKVDGEELIVNSDLKIMDDGSVLAAINTKDKDLIIYKFTSELVADSNFGSSGMIQIDLDSSRDEDILAIEPLANNKILFVGRHHDGTRLRCILGRLNSDGSLDSTFGSIAGGGYSLLSVYGLGDEECVDVVVQEDEKIVIAGNSWNGTDFDLFLGKLESDGKSFDVSFGSSGGRAALNVGDDEKVIKMILSDDGKFTLGGNYADVSMLFARYDKDGQLDTTFSGNGVGLFNPYGSSEDVKLNDFDLRKDGQIVFSGDTIETYFTGIGGSISYDGSWYIDGKTSLVFKSYSGPSPATSMSAVGVLPNYMTVFGTEHKRLIFSDWYVSFSKYGFMVYTP